MKPWLEGAAPGNATEHTRSGMPSPDAGFDRNLAEPPNVDDLKGSIAEAPARRSSPDEGSSGAWSGEAQAPGERHC
ncbi:MAG: hypothetical protein JW751_08465 [Polyangiaceae bacterium]|nr:hypothetical protein [Polyangiaceae bacterium]